MEQNATKIVAAQGIASPFRCEQELAATAALK
jgi:hypothetical protein